MTTLWVRATAIERWCYLVGLALVASGLLHVVILVATGASWEGPLSLRKPATFGLSFGLTLITLTGLISWLELRPRPRAALMIAFASLSILETALISLQAWRGVPSHFNVETPFDAWVTRGLAIGGIALIALVVLLTVAAFRLSSRVPASVRLTLQAGFAALCAAMAVGGVMIARGMTLVFSGHAQEAFASGGALKPIHAVTMHGILVLPVFAWLLSLSNWSEPKRLAVARLAVVAYLLVVAGVTAVTLHGM